ncbi:hypothetical protein OT109_03995 [Phycisphaeraceae bacterium D3-23]
MDDALPPTRKRPWLNKRDVAVALAGPALVLVLFFVYLASPGTWVQGVSTSGDPSLLLFDAHGKLLPGAELGIFLKYVVEESHREYQLVEMITFACSLLAGVLGLGATWLVLRQSRTLPKGGLGPLARYAAPAVLGATALAAIFFAGEEVNWGQTFARWGHSEMVTTQADGEQYRAQSVHNNFEGLSIQSLGSAYLLGVMVGVPIWWHIRREARRLPERWLPAIACWPAGFMVLYAYVVKACKDIYKQLFAGDSPKLDPMYMGYFEQINEQKEMLLAIAMLIYMAYALARARSHGGGEMGVEPDPVGS